MEETKKTSLVPIAIVVLVVIALIFISVFNTSNKGYKIGAVVALTGNNSGYGQAAQKGMDLAIEELNKDGKKIDVVYEDETSSPDGAIKAFQKLISVDRVPVAIGFMASNSTLAAAPIANSSKVVELSTLAGSDDIKNAGDYVFRIRESSASHGTEMAKYAKNILKYDSVAMFYANAANGISYADYFKAEFISLGGKIVLDQKYAEKSADFRSDLLKIKALKPQAVYIAGVAPDMAQILVQAKEIGLKTQWLASAGAENPKLIEIAKNAAEGLIFTTPAFNPDQANSSVQKFTEAYVKKYNEKPNFVAANGYDGIMLIYQVIKKYGYGAENIKNGLYATKDFPGVGGTFSFDSFGEVQKTIMFKTVKDGQFVPLAN